MKRIIKTILKEEVSQRQEMFQRRIMDMLRSEGFHGGTDYLDIIKFLNKHFNIKGMEAFEMYQLFKDNYRTGDEEELVRTDIQKRKLRSANNRSRELVQNKIPFKASNTDGEYIGNTYVVSSYGWYPIFVYKDGQWFENKDKYSVSTSKQTSQLRPYGEDIIKVSTQQLRDLI